MRRDSANKNAEFSLLVSAMGCPQERKLFISIYSFSSTMTLQYYSSPFCIRPSKKYLYSKCRNFRG